MQARAADAISKMRRVVALPVTKLSLLQAGGAGGAPSAGGSHGAPWGYRAALAWSPQGGAAQSERAS